MVLLHQESLLKQTRLFVPKCQGEMRIISLIDQPGVIKKFFNTWVYGKSPTPLLKETLR